MTERPVIYAIGDVHGRDDLLERLYGQIQADAERRYWNRVRRIVHLGDYVDRGPASRQVIERAIAGLPGFESVCLKGNHEDMMLSYLETGTRWDAEQWLINGGLETLESYGAAGEPLDIIAVRDAIGERHWRWLEGLKLSHREPGYFFVHAGIVPGRPLEEQEEKDLLWIRYAFLNSREDHGVRVVHGHTPVDAPEVRPNRINLDTGAYFSGHLTCAVFDGTENGGAPRFLMT
ncbi:MAG: metallophosphoesterase family protein [Alphaproteobacteria bacterium]